MTQLKKITVSFKETDTDLIDFFGRQRNTSLSVRIICKKWIIDHGSGDVADFLTTQSGKDTRESEQNKRDNAPHINQSINSPLIDDDIDDDFDDL